MEENLPQVQTIQTMQEAYDVVETLSKQTSGAIQKALRAQLAVVQLLQKPILVRTCIDTVFENLYQGIEEASSEAEIKLMRNQSALLVQSTLFFVQATILKKKNESKEEGKDLFRIATQNVASFSGDILKVYIEGQIGEVTTLKSRIESGFSVFNNYLENKKQIDKNLPDEAKEMFHKRFANFVFGFFENSKEEEDYLKLLDSVFEKFERNKVLLGKSILLSELIMNNYQEIIDYKLRDDLLLIVKKEKDLTVIKPTLFNGWYLLIYPFIFISLLISFIIDYFAKTTFIASTFMYYWLLFPLPIYAFKYFKNNLKKKKLIEEINEIKLAITEKKTALKHKYESISKTLNPYS